MASEWQEVRLGDAVVMKSGGTPRKSESAYWGGSIPWLSAKDMKSFRIHDTEDHVTEAGAANGTRLMPAGATFLLVRGMTLLNDIPIVVGKKAMTFNQDVKGLLPKNGVVSSFIPYLLLGMKSTLRDLVDLAGHGTGRLNTDRLQDLPCFLPEEDEQSRIVAFLSALDDRIDHNRALAANLEAIARTLFKSWFVKFDPVRAKAAGEVPPGLVDEIADLFPDRFVDSELGEIPEGWGFTPLSHMAEFVNGRNFTKGATGSGRAVIRIAELSNDGPTNSTIWNDLPNAEDRHIANSGDILFAWSGSLGVHVWDHDPGLVNQHIFKVLPRESFSNPFCYFAVEELIEEFRAIAASKAVTMGHIKRGDLDTHGVICPNARTLVEGFGQLVRPLWERTRVARREALVLSAIRDLLLPRLISGKLRVEDAALETAEDGAVAPVGRDAPHPGRLDICSRCEIKT